MPIRPLIPGSAAFVAMPAPQVGGVAFVRGSPPG